MRNGCVQKANFEDAWDVGQHLRRGDYDELYAATGTDPVHTVVKSFEAHPESCYIFRWDKNDAPLAIWGCVPAFVNGLAVPWMVATPDAMRYPREIITISREFTKEWNDQYPLLVNYVDARNKISIRWLKSMGYSFIQLHAEYGFAKIPFWEFVRINPCVHQHS